MLVFLSDFLAGVNGCYLHTFSMFLSDLHLSWDKVEFWTKEESERNGEENGWAFSRALPRKLASKENEEKDHHFLWPSRGEVEGIFYCIHSFVLNREQEYFLPAKKLLLQSLVSMNGKRTALFLLFAWRPTQSCNLIRSIFLPFYFFPLPFTLNSHSSQEK